MALAVGCLYRFAPAQTPEGGWGVPGVIVATGLWIAGSVLFAYTSRSSQPTIHASDPRRDHRVLVWLYLVVFAILLGGTEC